MYKCLHHATHHLLEIISALIVANVVWGHDIIYLFSPLTNISLGSLGASYAYGPLAAMALGWLVWVTQGKKRVLERHIGFASAAAIVSALPPIIRAFTIDVAAALQQSFGSIVYVPEAGQNVWLLAPLIFIGFCAIPAVLAPAKKRQAMMRAIGGGIAITLAGVAVMELLRIAIFYAITPYLI